MFKILGMISMSSTNILIGKIGLIIGLLLTFFVTLPHDRVGGCTMHDVNYHWRIVRWEVVSIIVHMLLRIFREMVRHTTLKCGL